jgi:choline dehydrogenase-like flavoprotein
MIKDSTSINLNVKGKAQHTFDAIVIGSGITGGWAAKELCDKGLKTLMLERGKDVVHLKDYPTATTPNWNFKHHNKSMASHITHTGDAANWRRER